MGPVLSSAHEKFGVSIGPKSFDYEKLYKSKTTIPYSRGLPAEGGVGVHQPRLQGAFPWEKRPGYEVGCPCEKI